MRGLLQKRASFCTTHADVQMLQSACVDSGKLSSQRPHLGEVCQEHSYAAVHNILDDVVCHNISVAGYRIELSIDMTV